MFHRLAAFFFPDQCVFCKSVLPYRKDQICICPKCLRKITFLDEVKTCRICGRPVAKPEILCKTCQTHRHFFNRALSCLIYEKETRSSILRYKFSGRRDYCRTFGKLLGILVTPQHQKSPFDLVVYPPISESALKKRGYNQSFLLARQVAEQLGVPLAEDAFVKRKETPKQSTLHYAERLENVISAFGLSAPKEMFRNKTILIVDDVLTTGATVDALAKLLRSAKASSVYVATLATTQLKQGTPLSEEEMDALRY